MKRLIFGLVTPVLALLAGCATVTTEYVGPGEVVRSAPSTAPWCDRVADPKTETCEDRPEGDVKAAPAGDGIAYFLPRQLVRVSATRTGGVLSDAIDALFKAQGELAAAEAKVSAAEDLVRETEDALVDNKLTDQGREILNTRLKAQKADLEKQKTASGKKETAVTDAKAAVTAATGTAGAGAAANAGPGAYTVALKMELLPPSPDRNHAYRLDPRHMPYRDDEHKVKVSAAGLLNTTNITATDRTGDILIELAAFAGAIKGAKLNMVGFDGRDAGTEKDCTNSPSEFNGVVDFVNPAAVALLNDDLQCLGVRLIPEGRYWPAETRPAPSPNSFYTKAIEGIVYRSPAEVEVRVEKCVEKTGACTPDGKGQWLVSQVVAFALPQAGPISYVRQDAGFLTKTNYALTFQDGMLVDFSGNRPSEFLQAASVPMKLVHSFFDGVSKVVSLRTGRNNDQAAYLASLLAVNNGGYNLRASAYTGERQVAEAQLGALQSQFDLQAAPLQGKTKILQAEQANLQQQFLGQLAALQNQTTLSKAQADIVREGILQQIMLLNGTRDIAVADLEVIQQQYARRAADAVGAAQLANADLTRVQAQTAYGVGSNTAAAQLSSSAFAAWFSEQSDQAKKARITQCITAKLQANLPVDTCLVL